MKNFFEYLPQSVIYLIVFLLPFFFLPFSVEYYEFNKLYLLFFLILIGFLGWFGKLILVERAFVFRRTPLDKWVLLFLLAFVVSAIFSQDWRNSVFGLYGRFSGGAIEMTLWVLFYFLLTQYITVSEIKNVLKVLFCSTILVSVSFLLSFFGLVTRVPLTQSIFLSALGISPQGLAVFLGVTLALLVSQWVLGGSLTRNTRIFFGVTLVLHLVVLAMINFPPVWIMLVLFFAALVGISLFFKLLEGSEFNRLSLPMFLTLVSLFLLFAPSLLGFFSISTGIPTEILLNERASWGVSIDAFKSSPLTGIGPGNWQEAFLLRKPIVINTTPVWRYRFDTPLSHYAALFSTTGAIGTVSFLVLLGMVGLLFAYSFFHREATSVTKRAVLLATLCFAALLGSFLFYYQTISLSLLFWLLLGMMGIIFAKAYDSRVFRREFGVTPEANLFLNSLFFVGVFIFGSLMIFGARFYYADVLYQRALALSPSQTQLNLLGRANSLNPFEPEYALAASQAAFQYGIQEAGKVTKENAEKLLPQITPYFSFAVGQNGALSQMLPHRLSIWESRGVLYRELRGLVSGDSTALAVDAFNRAFVLAPTDPTYYGQIARLYLEANDTKKANEALQKALALKKDYLPGIIVGALIKEQEGKKKEAVETLEAIVALPNLSGDVAQEAGLHLGRMYLNENESSKAAEVLEQVTKINPRHANAHYALGLAYERKGEDEKALEEYKKVQELSPQNPDIQNRIDALGKK